MESIGGTFEAPGFTLTLGWVGRSVIGVLISDGGRSVVRAEFDGRRVQGILIPAKGPAIPLVAVPTEHGLCLAVDGMPMLDFSRPAKSAVQSMA
jgi:hypothetical protein